MIQLRHGQSRPEIRRVNTWDSLDAIHSAGLLTHADWASLSAGYSFLRLVEARLRIMTNRPLDEYPENAEELEKLARRVGCADAETFLYGLRSQMAETREIFVRLTGIPGSI